MQIPDGSLTQAAYARHRGVTKPAVGQAIASGRLRESIVEVNGKKRIRDAALADQEWEKNTDAGMRLRATGLVAPPAALVKALGPPPTIDTPPEPEAEPDAIGDFQAARIRKEVAQADMAELKFKELAGGLIPAKDVERQLTSYLTNCKTLLLAIPSRARQALPHLTAADSVVIENLLREALEQLADAS